MSEFKVGQILYVIPADTASVIPIQIVERRISETSSGTVVKHIVQSPNTKSKPMVLETIKGVVFADLKQVRDTMVKNATIAIDNMVKHAANVARDAFSPPEEKRPPQPESDQFNGEVFLGDIDHGSNEQMLPMLPSTERETANGSDLNHGDSFTEIMTPDGRKQRVRLKMP